MPLIPLIVPPYQNGEELGAASTSVELIDGVIDEFRTLRPRGGLIKWVNFPDTRCLGIYWWKSRNLVMAVFGEYLFSIKENLAITKINGETTRLHPTGLATFTANEYWLYIANGGQILCWDGTSDPSYALSPAPNPCSHVAYIDGFIIGNKVNTQSWYYADPDPADAAAKHVWAATGLSKDGGPDLLQAVKAAWREVLLIGERTAEIWYDSGDVSVFSRMEGAFIEMGTPAPHSVINADNTWIWLNQFRQVIRLNGRTPTVISTGIEKQLKAIGKADDAVATLMDSKYIISFPTDNITWVYDLKQQYWCQWGKWEGGYYDRWLGESSINHDSYGIDIVTGKAGHLYLYHPLISTDDTAVIRCLYRSPHFNHGTYHRKISHGILNVKQGSGIPFINNVALPDGIRCVPYSFTPETQDGWTIISISGFPANIILNVESQTIEGIPYDSGTFNVVIYYRNIATQLTLPIRSTIYIEDSAPVILLPGE